MNNADRMRAELSAQMLKLTLEQLYKLVNTAEELEPDDNVIDLGNLFTCKKCRKKYGECSEETKDCESRFLRFCKEEAP